MMDLQERLRTHMDSEMSATRQRDLGDVMERGEIIRRRRRLVSTALPAAAVALVVAGVMLSDRLPAGETDAPEVEALAAADAQLSVEQRALDWSSEAATLGFQQQSLVSDGVLYSLSTAPGARFEDFPNGDAPKAIYTSADGTDWSAHPVDGAWVSSIAAADGLLYAVGTAPGADADSAALRIEVSEDRGESFTGKVFPIHADQPGMTTAEVMATDRGVLATATTRTSNDPFTLLPPGALEGAVEPLMVEQPEGGIAVFPLEAAEEAYEVCTGQDPDRCGELVETEATRFFAWEELGVEDEGMLFGQRMTTAAYWSEDGANFREIEYPFPEGAIRSVHTVGEEVVVSLDGAGGVRLFASEDARSWQPVDGPRPGWIQAMGTTGDRVVLVAGANGGQPSIFHAADLAGPWEEIPLSEVIELPDPGDESLVWVTAATVGESGVALNLSIPTQEGGSNPIGAVLDRLTGGGNEAPERVTEPARPTGVMLHSSDLKSWSVIPSADLGGHVDSLLTTPDGRLIAHASVPGDDGRPVRQQYSAQP